MTTHRLLLALPTLLLPLTAAPAAVAQPDDQSRPMLQHTATQQGAPPLTEVTLYTSGVGLYTHTGEAAPTIDLDFRAEQMSDVLKSLLIEAGGAAAPTVHYDAALPLQRRLDGLAFDLSGLPADAGTADLLTRLIGVEVRLELHDGTAVEGRVLSVESREEPAGESEPARTVDTLSLWIGTGVRPLDLAEVGAVHLADADLAGDIGKALALTAGELNADSRALEVRLGKDAAGPVALSYLLDSPRWKISYRLALPSGGPDQSDDVPRLQGWAVVDNTSGRDWDGVRLNLVSGRPVSFQMDLYGPQYIQRPTLGLTDSSVDAPELADAGIPQRAKLIARGLNADSGLDFMAEAAVASGPASGALSPSAATGASNASGEQFAYTIQSSVDVAAGQSVMVPVLSAEVIAERVSLINTNGSQGQRAADGGWRPVRAVDLTNTSGLKLEGGPVSILESAGGERGGGLGFSGDARFDFLNDGEQRLLPYAIDTALRVTDDQTQSSEVTRGSLKAGVLRLTRVQRRATTYAASRSASEARRLLIEHNRLNGWELAAPDAALDETADAYRFALDVPAGETIELEVVLERTRGELLALVDLSETRLLALSRDAALDEDLRAELEQAAARQRELAAAAAEAEAAAAERDRVAADQKRIRENLAPLEAGTPLYRRYTEKLNEQEDRLDALTEKEEAARERAEAIRSELREM